MATAFDLEHHKYLEAFPYPQIRPVQDQALAFVARHGSAALEIPTGEGKTAVGITYLRKRWPWKGIRVYVTPTKQQVEQVLHAFPDETVAIFGRSEYPCLYYADRGLALTAAESPCYMLACPHRVNQETGEAQDADAAPCPYFQAKFEGLRQSLKDKKIIVTTTAFFLMNRREVKTWQNQELGAVVIDEAHNIAKVARSLFEYRITDVHLLRVSKLLAKTDRAAALAILNFVRCFRGIARKYASQTQVVLKDEEIERLMEMLGKFDEEAAEKAVRSAIASGAIDPQADREALKQLENIVRQIPRMLKRLEYATETEGRKPSNYVIAFYVRKEEAEEGSAHRRARYIVTIKSYIVGNLIRKAAGERVLAYTATLGRDDIFTLESGLRLPIARFGSSFETAKTRIYLPRDMPDLASRKRKRDDLKKTLKAIVASAKRFAEQGHRSLIVVVSEAEREQCLKLAEAEGLDIMSYHADLKAREAAAAFKEGMGETLLGTAAQYAEGIDLPGGSAPVIFFLRPGYAPPSSPESQFERKRWGDSHSFALARYRVMLEALQVRGRNVRSYEDLGVCFFMSRGFKPVLLNALPQWLEPAYRDTLTLKEAIADAEKLLK